jgi:curved DNA-binding protein CbpA
MWSQLIKNHSKSLLNVPRGLFSKLDNKPDLYVLLELKPTATQEQIRYNYFKLMAKYNPDGNGDPSGHSQLLNQAYIILSNDKLKAKYDL